MRGDQTRPGGHCQILPPAIVNRIIEKGTARQRERALRTLSVDHSLRSGRVGRTAQANPGPRWSPRRPHPPP